MSPVAGSRERGTGAMVLGCLLAAVVAIVGIGFMDAGRRVIDARLDPTTRAETWKAGAKRPRKEPTITEVIESVFGPNAPTALSVARCESRLEPTARGPGGVGVFQIHPRHHTWRVDAVGGSELTDAETNIRVARHLFEEEGWSPWTCARILGYAA